MATALSADVVVIGAGVFGLCVAFETAGRGADVLVLEAATAGASASGGIVGALSPHTPDQWNAKKQFQFEALHSAPQFWSAVESQSSMTTGYGRIGRLQPLASERQISLAKARQGGAKAHWGGQYAWEYYDAVRELDASCTPFGLVRDNLSARIHPRQACMALKAACLNTGVKVLEGHEVSNLSNRQVIGPWGSVNAGKIVLAAGVGGFQLLKPVLGMSPGSGVKGQAALLKLDLTGRSQIYADGVYIIPHADGTVAVGSTSENSWEHATKTDSQLDDLIARAAKFVPEIQTADVLQRWAGLRPKARRRDPLLGPVPGMPDVIAALGGFKIGFGIAPKVGEMIAQMCSGAPVDLPHSFTFDWHLEGAEPDHERRGSS